MERLTILDGRLYKSVAPTYYFFKVAQVCRFKPLIGVISRLVEPPLNSMWSFNQNEEHSWFCFMSMHKYFARKTRGYSEYNFRKKRRERVSVPGSNGKEGGDSVGCCVLGCRGWVLGVWGGGGCPPGVPPPPPLPRYPHPVVTLCTDHSTTGHRPQRDGLTLRWEHLPEVPVYPTFTRQSLCEYLPDIETLTCDKTTPVIPSPT